MGKVQIHTPPWGLSCAQDIFQRMMDQILECCKRVIGMINYVVIYENDDEDHDWNLHNFMHRVCEHDLVFNGEKCEVKKDSVTFFKTVYDANGAHPDPKKLDVIHKIPSLDDKLQLQHVLGWLHISHLSSHHSLHTLHHYENC